MEIDHQYLENYILTPANKRNAYINTLLPTTNEYVYLQTIDNLISEKANKMTPQEIQEKILKASLGTNTQKQLILIALLNKFTDKATTVAEKYDLIKEIGIQLGLNNFSSNMFLAKMSTTKAKTQNDLFRAPAPKGKRGKFGKKQSKPAKKILCEKEANDEDEEDFQEDEDDEEMDISEDSEPKKKQRKTFLGRSKIPALQPATQPVQPFGQSNIFGNTTNNTDQSIFQQNIFGMNNQSQQIFMPSTDQSSEPKIITRRSSARVPPQLFQQQGLKDKMEVESDDSNKDESHSDQKQQIIKRGSKMSIQSKKSQISKRQSVASVKQQPQKKGKQAANQVQSQLKYQTQPLLEEYIKNKFSWNKINPEYYHYIDLEQLPEDLDVHTQIQFLNSIQISKRVNLVEFLTKIISHNSKQRLNSFQFSEIFRKMSYTQMEAFLKKNSQFVGMDTVFFIGMVQKKFHKELKYFKERYYSMKNSEKQEYIEFLTDLKVWLEKVPPKNDCNEYLTSKVLFCLIQVSCELEIYDEDVFKKLLKKNSYLQSCLYWLQDQSFNRRVIEQKQAVDSEIIIECCVPHQYGLSICGTYLYNILAKNTSNTDFYYKTIENNFLDQLIARVQLEKGEEVDDELKEKLDSNILENIYKEKYILFCQKNEKIYKVSEEIKIQCYLKNVTEVTVNVFQIEPKNYYLEFEKSFDQKINLDGIIPQHSKKHKFDDLQNGLRKQCDFPLPEIDNRGVFVVEVSGDGILSRAIIKKGALTFHYQDTETDRIFYILDEDFKICKPIGDKETGIYIDKKYFAADKNGKISLTSEFVCQHQNFNIILVHNEFASFIDYNSCKYPFKTDDYKFQCIVMGQQENFIREQKANLLISPRLYNRGLLVPMDVLKDCKIIVTVNYPKLGERQFEFLQQFSINEDIKIEFPIISKPKSILIQAKCKKPNEITFFSINKTYTFKDYSQNSEHDFSVNSMHFHMQNGEYAISILNKDGQRRANIPVNVTVTNIYFNESITELFKTDKNGQILLGDLKDCSKVTATTNENEYEVEVITCEWNVQNKVNGLFDVQYPINICELLGEQIILPVKSEGFDEEDFSLNQFLPNSRQFDLCVEDYSQLIKYDEKTNSLNLNFSEPGHYILKIFSLKVQIPIEIVQGQKVEGSEFIYDEHNKSIHKIKKCNDYQVQIKEVNFQKNSFEIQLYNIDKSVFNPKNLLRVHIFAYNFIDKLTEQWFATHRRQIMENEYLNSDNQDSHLLPIQNQECSFFAQKIESKEMVYSLQRQNQEKFSSLNLQKPKIFLNQAFYSTTNNIQEENIQEQDFVTSGGGRVYTRNQIDQINKQELSYIQVITSQAKENFQSFINDREDNQIDKHIDFLENSVLISQNCRVSANGKVQIKDFPLENYQMIGIYCSNFKCSVIRNFQIPHDTSYEVPKKELALQKILDKDCGYQECREMIILQPGQSQTISKTSEKLVISGLPNIYNIFVQKNLNDPNFRHWQFLKCWTSLTFNAKSELYNEFASHELNLFIYFKDEKFFNKQVRDFIKFKLVKTFVDYFLLDMKTELLRYSELQNSDQLNIMEKCLLVLFLVKMGHPKRAHQLNQEIQNLPVTDNENIKNQLFDEIVNFQMNDEAETREMNTNKYVEEENQFRNDDGENNFGFGFGNSLYCNNISFNNKNIGSATQNYLYNQIQDSQLYQSYSHGNSHIRSGQNWIVTKQYVERTYYCQPGTDFSNIFATRDFWKNLSEHIIKKKTVEKFVSENYNVGLAYTISEIAMVLTFMDLSFDTKSDKIIQKTLKSDIQITNQTQNPIIMYSKNTIPVHKKQIITDLLVKQKVFDPFNQIDEKDGLKFERTLTNLCINKVYGLRTIATNGSINQFDLTVYMRLQYFYISIFQILMPHMQIPQGAVPVNCDEYIHVQSVNLREHQYAKYNQYFYFPFANTFELYPAALLNNGQIVGRANEQQIKVLKAKVDEPGEKKNISEMIRLGDKKSILKHIAQETVYINIHEYKKFLENDKGFYKSFVQVMQDRNLFSKDAWMYVFRHNENVDISIQLLNNVLFQKQYLRKFQLLYFKNGDIFLDLIVFFEFSPIVRFRAHTFDKEKKVTVMNQEFQKIYKKFLIYIIQKQNSIEMEDRLVFCYYLALQERYSECKEIYQQIEKGKIIFEIQYDYLTAYLNMYDGGYPNFQIARKICERYEDYPILSWRNMFLDISNKLSEYDEGFVIEKEIMTANEQDDAKKEMNVSTTQKMELYQEKKGDENLMKFKVQNIDEIHLDYYLLDVEAIFSRNPFFMSESKFNFVKANHTETINVKEGQIEKFVNIPKQMANKNIYVNADCGSIKDNLTILINQIDIEVLEDFGVVTVKKRNKETPIVKAYVKVFAKNQNGQIQFYRDGYTDLVGRFDYAMSQYNFSNNKQQYSKFVILVSTEEFGLDIKEVNVPTVDMTQKRNDFSFKDNQMKRTMKQMGKMNIDQDEDEKQIIRRASSRKRVKY